MILRFVDAALVLIEFARCLKLIENFWSVEGTSEQLAVFILMSGTSTSGGVGNVVELLREASFGELWNT